MSISQANMASHVPGTSLSPSPTGVERNVVGLQQRRPTIKKMLKVFKILVVFISLIVLNMVQKYMYNQKLLDVRTVKSKY